MSQEQTVEAATSPALVQYRLHIEIVAAMGIEPELFVHDVTADSYKHVAALNDLQLYPNNKATALADDVMFYRKSSADLVFTDQATASNASSAIQARLKLVNSAAGAVSVAPFGGVETFVYDSVET